MLFKKSIANIAMTILNSNDLYEIRSRFYMALNFKRQNFFPRSITLI